jgi:hypothetical protein
MHIAAGIGNLYIWPLYMRYVACEVQDEVNRWPAAVLDLTTSDGTARIPLIHYKDATKCPKAIKAIQDDASTVHAFCHRSC